MNKFWISTISAAGTLGTAGAAFAGVNVVDHLTTSTDSPSTATTLDTAGTQATSADRTVAYQVGAAGTVTITLHDGELTVVDVVAADGWSVVGASAPGVHVEVQLTDGSQVVTFGADIVGADIAVTVTSALSTTDTTSPDTTIPGTFDVTIISDVPDDDALQLHPGTPGVGSPTTTVPFASTTAPSGGGDDEYDQDESDDDEHESDDSHEDEVEDDD